MTKIASANSATLIYCRILEFFVHQKLWQDGTVANILRFAIFQNISIVYQYKGNFCQYTLFTTYFTNLRNTCSTEYYEITNKCCDVLSTSNVLLCFYLCPHCFLFNVLLFLNFVLFTFLIFFYIVFEGQILIFSHVLYSF